MIGRCSNLFDDLLNDVSPKVHFEINGREYNMPYYLVDGIYPTLATFVPAVVPNPVTHKQMRYTMRQESCRKDVGRAFGVIQARFQIIKHPALAHSRQMLEQIMDCCIVLHNMVVEDERDRYLNYDQAIEDWIDEYDNDTREIESKILKGVSVITRPSVINDMADCAKNHFMMHSFNKHDELKYDLVEHIWRSS